MDKVKFDIPDKTTGKWGSYISKYPSDSGRVQPNMMTLDSVNAISSATGSADKRQGGAIWNVNNVLSGPALDQYEGVFNTGTRLFIVNDAGTIKASTGNGLFTSLQSGFTNPSNFEFVTYQSRVYGCNGVDNPIVIDINTSYGGVSYSFTTAKTKTMGAQVPSSACTATLVSDSTTNQVPAGGHTYKVTYMYYGGVEESNGNLASSVVTNDSSHTQNSITNIPVGGYGVTARRLYRDNNDGNWLLLTQINDNTTTTYTDKAIIGATPTAIPQFSSLPPLFKYCALYLDRLFVIDTTGKNIYWSTAGEPDCFNPNNVISGPQDDVMTAVYVYNGIPWVFGQHTVGQILGTTDGSFYYNPVSSSVGCIDNRSIQTRSIVSVPTMVWLAATPNKGIYYTNGAVVQYLSDFIEDLTFNLAQVSYLSRSNTQASQAAFQGGTASSGIDLISNPGTIQTINPVATFSHALDWASGVLTNLSQIGDTLQVPVQFPPTLASGALSGSAQLDLSGTVVDLVVTAAWDGDTTGGGHYGSNTLGGGFSGQKIAIPIEPPVNGTLTEVDLLNFAGWTIGQINSGSLGYTLKVWNDGGGQPGSEIYSQVISSPGSWNGSVTGLSVSMTGGLRYWVGIAISNYAASVVQVGQFSFGPPSGALADATSKFWNGSTWNSITISGANCRVAFNINYTPVTTTGAGVWTSPIYDTQSTTNTNVGMKLTVAGSYPTSTTISVVVQGSANDSTWTTTDTLTNPNGAVTLTGGTYRYWQLIFNLSTTDNTVTPNFGPPVLTFDTAGNWVSPPIDCTSDITALSALLLNATIPAGTTATVTMATSASMSSGYSSFTSIGSATPNTWAKIQLSLTTDSGNTTSPAINSTELDWAVTSNLISSAIDTGAVPAGWGIFQFQEVGLAGTIAFYFRSASTSGGLSSATFAPVTNGGFPTSSTLEWCQWKCVMTATANNMPEVDSVTVNWLLTSGANVRAASLFFNKSYYLSVAKTGSTHNDTLIELDYEGNWRVHTGVSIGTMATYFNNAFYCDAANGNIYSAFQLPTDNGTNITFDIRTKCFNFGEDERLMLTRSVRVKGVNTGTTIHVYFTVDKGATWVEMLNSSGTVGYTTTNDGSYFNEYFVPDYSGVTPFSGPTMMFRVVSSDQYPCSILKVRPSVYVRKGKYIAEANA